MAAAMALASISKANGAEIIEQSCLAQTIALGAEAGQGLYWPLAISLVIQLLLVLIVLRLVLRQERGVHIIYSTAPAPDAEARDTAYAQRAAAAASMNSDDGTGDDVVGPGDHPKKHGGLLGQDGSA